MINKNVSYKQYKIPKNSKIFGGRTGLARHFTDIIREERKKDSSAAYRTHPFLHFCLLNDSSKSFRPETTVAISCIL